MLLQGRTGQHILRLPASRPIGALLISVWIFRGVYRNREAVNNVTGGAGSPELTQRIIDTAVSVPGVQDVHQVIVEHVGPEVRADLHINMDGAMPLVQVHAISDRVREAIEGLEGVEHAFIHVEPVDEHSANLPVQEPMRNPSRSAAARRCPEIRLMP